MSVSDRWPMLAQDRNPLAHPPVFVRRRISTREAFAATPSSTVPVEVVVYRAHLNWRAVFGYALLFGSGFIAVALGLNAWPAIVSIAAGLIGISSGLLVVSLQPRVWIAGPEQKRYVEQVGISATEPAKGETVSHENGHDHEIAFAQTAAEALGISDDSIEILGEGSAVINAAQRGVQRSPPSGQAREVQKPITSAARVQHEPAASRILVAINGSDTDDEAIRVASEVAMRGGNAAVYCIYVIEIGRRLPLDVDLPEDAAKGDLALSRAERIADKFRVKVATEIVQARDAGVSIVDDALELEIDLLVMGISYGQKSNKFDLGHTASYVLKNATCRVWLVRAAHDAQHTVERELEHNFRQT